MKGVVFTEFLAFVELRFGADMADDIIDSSHLDSGGAYTAVGTYSHDEMVALCSALAEKTGLPTPGLVRDFGQYLSDSFASSHPDFFNRAGNLFDFLESIEAHIHVEVRKLYPDAELPTFAVEERTISRLVMVYRSPRRMADLSEGLIIGSAGKFGVKVRVHAAPSEGSDGTATRFVIQLE